MPRALLRCQTLHASHARKLLFPHGSWLAPGSFPSRFSGNTAVLGPLSACSAPEPAELPAPGTLPAAPHPWKDEAPGEDVVKLFFLSAARIRSLGPFHPSESSSAAAWLLFQVHSGCSVSKSPFFHTEYCRVSGGLSLPCEGEHHLARLPSRSLDCLQHTGLLLELGREFGGAMFGHFQQVWGWKPGRMGGFAPTMGWKITMSTEGIHFDNLELREKKKVSLPGCPMELLLCTLERFRGPIPVCA